MNFEEVGVVVDVAVSPVVGSDVVDEERVVVDECECDCVFGELDCDVGVR